MIFADRRDAGRRLGKKLLHLRGKSGVVLGIPRGGVAVAHEVARVLDWPLDVVMARKVGAPFNRELALAAVAPDGVVLMNEELAGRLHVQPPDIADLVAAQMREIDRRLRLYRGDRPPADLGGKTAIVVDDGVATGLTVSAALVSLRGRRPDAIVLAVPIASREAVEALRPLVDELVVLLVPEDFYAVGQFYRDFRQVTDEEVVRLLTGTGHRTGP